MKKGLTKREREFCHRYLCCGDAEASALSAGYSKNPSQAAHKLLLREDILGEISRLSQLRKQLSHEMARVGYQRLAFGSVADAMSLLYMDNPSRKQLEEMDLFSVSEIKRKENSVEIKFFDRFKALEKLEEESSQEDGADTVYNAILMGAKALSKEDTDEP